MVSVLAFDYDDPSSNPAAIHILYETAENV